LKGLKVELEMPKTQETEMKRVTKEEALELILASDGKFFAVTFLRVKPKCTRCETSHKLDSESAEDHICHQPYCHKCDKKVGLRAAKKGVCPDCGSELAECHGELEYTRDATGRLGVKVPGEGITDPGTGAKSTIGGFNDRLEREEPLVTVYDVTVEGDRTDDHKGGYRCFRLSNLIRLAVEGSEYEVIDTE
jgi:hypothetical protein